MYQMRAPTILLATLCYSGLAYAQAINWSTCASDLDDLRKASEYASSTANEVQSKQRRLSTAKDELSTCLRLPEIYDLSRNGCQNKHRDHNSSLTSLRSAVASLRSALGDVERRARSVSSSCGYDIPAPPGTNELCSIYLRYQGQLPVSKLVEACTQIMPESECKKCFGVK